MVQVNSLKIESVPDYLKQFSKSTKPIYKSMLKGYFEMVYPQLKEAEDIEAEMRKLTLEYVEDLERDYGEDILAYRDLIKDKAPKTRSSHFSCIFGYLEQNNLEFPKRWKKNIVGRGSNQAISEEKVPTPDELKRIIYHLPSQARAYVFIMATGGMRPGEALGLNLSDLDLDYVATFTGADGKIKNVPIPKINLRHANTKTKIKRFTFITQEAKREVESFLDYRDEYIERLKRRGIKGSFQKKIDEGRIFPFSEQTFSGIWTIAIKKAGLYVKDTVTKRITLRPHNLRKFFETWGNWSNPAVPECLAGHIEGMRKIYQRMDQAERLLVEAYKAAEPNITLSGQVVVSESPEEITELKNWNRQLRLEILEGKEDRRRLRELIGEVVERLGRTEAFIEIIGYDPDLETGEVKYDPEKDQRRE